MKEVALTLKNKNVQDMIEFLKKEGWSEAKILEFIEYITKE